MEVRKLVKAGKHSHSVSLPKGWLTQHSLKTGDSVYIIQGEKEVTVTPFPTAPTNEVRERTIEVGDRSIETVRRELTSAYINNYTDIRFSKVKNHDDVLGVLQDFVALEIVDQQDTTIAVKDLLNLSEINVDQSLRRMDMIIRTLFKEAEPREKDLNKLYFLLYRLVKGAMRDQKMADALNIKQDNILLTWYLMVNLEDIGDILENMPKKAGLKDIENNYLDAMKAYFTNNKELAEQVISSWQSQKPKKGEGAEQVRQLSTQLMNNWWAYNII